jgi:hypothetical protein
MFKAEKSIGSLLLAVGSILIVQRLLELRLQAPSSIQRHMWSPGGLICVMAGLALIAHATVRGRKE